MSFSSVAASFYGETVFCISESEATTEGRIPTAALEAGAQAVFYRTIQDDFAYWKAFGVVYIEGTVVAIPT